MHAGLPCTIDVIEANPSLKADQGMGTLVGRFNISYECFDNEVASGRST